MVVRGSAWLAASWTSRRGTPGLERSSNEGVPQGVRTATLGDPRLSGDATSLTGPAHEDRALERPSRPSPIARLRARATLGPSGMVTTLPRLRVTVRVVL